MRRRTYLATATAAAVAGCTELGSSDPDEEPHDDVPTDDDPPPLEGPDEDGTLEGFATLEGWSVVAGVASMIEEDASVGDRSVLLEAGVEDDAARIVRELPEPVDWSGASPGLAVAAEEPITVLLQAFDDDGNVIDFRTTIHGSEELRRCNFGVAGIGDDADLGAISEIHVAFFASDDAERELLFDDLHLVSRPDDGLVTLQFDGGDESIHDEGLTILGEYGYPATAFVPTDLIREEADHDGNRLTESQLEDLDDAGWTIASYTANGGLLPDLEADEQADQFAEAREWLEDEGYDDGAGYVSYPAGQYDDRSLELAEGTYDLGFAGRYPVQGYVADPVRYPRVVDPDIEDAEAILDRTADLGGITALCYHALEDDALDRFEETMAYLDDLVDDGALEVIGPRTLETEYVADGGDGGR